MAGRRPGHLARDYRVKPGDDDWKAFTGMTNKSFWRGRRKKNPGEPKLPGLHGKMVA
jgi:hypothetical protein